ncbi:MAG TPA: BlaI/MecI/CopY family transcriptional regulator [Candidatus Binatia bacterium]|nr:BlaI/MecI/CopY family transcriptional regulator [Candidatus Binatia bacterium]
MAKNPRLEDVLGPLGAAVVREVLARREASVADVVDGLRRGGGRPYAYTTIMTVMSRLHERGVLERERHGRHYVYRPAAPEAEIIDHLSRVAVEQLVDRFGTAALRHFAVKLADLDPETRRRLADVAGGPE